MEKQMAKRGISFREIGPAKARAHYLRMSSIEFERINSRQEWANWFLIGKCLHDRVPNQPLRVLDVGCGSGTSTKVLAFYAPAGSSIIACDITPSLLEYAKAKTYTNLYSPESPDIRFVLQDATKPFTGEDGNPLPAHSIDYLNTSGIVGHHLARESFVALAQNATHVVRPQGWAAIDEGPAVGESTIVKTMQSYGWVLEERVRIVPWFKRGQLVFRRSG